MRNLDLLPEGWTFARLYEIAEIIMGQSPVGRSYNRDGIGYPLINGPVEFGARYPEPVQWTTRPTKYCESGDVLFCVRGSTTGRMNLANGRYCIGRGVAAIRAIEQVAATPYIERCLVGLAAEILQEARGNGSTFPSITSKRLAATPLLSPPLPEQRRIAAILDTVDDAIRQTERLIAKLKQAKQGLLHDLLTRGIKKNGEVRPSPEEAPHLYHKTVLGWVPKGWEVVRLGEVIAAIQAGSSPAATDTPAGWGQPGVLKVSAVHPDRFLPLENKALASERILAKRFEVADGDLLITRANTADLVGMPCLVIDPPPMLFLCDKTLRLICRHDRIVPPFLFQTLVHERAKRQISSLATGTSAGMKNISQQKLRSVAIAVPDISEQSAIVEHVDGLASNYREHTAGASKLLSLKTALMDDLLTGRVRTHTLPEGLFE